MIFLLECIAKIPFAIMLIELLFKKSSSLWRIIFEFVLFLIILIIVCILTTYRNIWLSAIIEMCIVFVLNLLNYKMKFIS
jgi:hypothetical protein